MLVEAGEGGGGGGGLAREAGDGGAAGGEAGRELPAGELVHDKVLEGEVVAAVDEELVLDVLGRVEVLAFRVLPVALSLLQSPSITALLIQCSLTVDRLSDCLCACFARPPNRRSAKTQL